MLNRIKIMTLLQLSNRFKFQKVTNVKKLLAKMGILSLGVILVTAVCLTIFYVLINFMGIRLPAYQPKWLLTFILLFLQLLSVIACSLGLLKTLYTSKDNAILLSYPAHHVEVYVSKLLVYYIYEFLKSIFFTLPLLVSFGLMYNYFSLSYVLNSLLFLVTLPLIPVLLGALITLPIVYIKKLLTKYSLIKSLFIILLLIGLFIAFIYFIKILPRPLRIKELLTTILDKFKLSLEFVHTYGFGINNVGNIISKTNVGFNYVTYFAFILGLLILVALISMPIYFKLASQSNEQSNEKKRKGVNKGCKNTFFTFVKKEFLLSIRNLSDFINNYIFTFATPYVFFMMMGLYTAMDLDGYGVYFTVVFSGFVMLLMCCASNTASSLALTKEGSEFVLLKTVPSNTANIAWAKIFFHLVYSSIMIVLSYVLVIVFCPMFETAVEGYELEWAIDNNWLWMMMCAVLCINAAMIFWSFQIDIMNPKLREYASSGDVSGMNNASKSIMIGLIVSLFFSVVVALLFFVGSKTMTTNWIIIMIISLTFLFARLYLFISHLKNVFPYIEY